jgi:hypothetical protein
MAADGALAPSGGKDAIMYGFIPDAANPGTGDKSILRVNDMKVAGGTADPSRQGDSRHETQ